MLAGMNATPELEGKARRDRAEIDAIVADYRQSGLTQVAFARQRGLNLGTFRSWLAKRRSRNLEGFCAVTVREESLEGLIVRLPGGIEVAVRGEVDPGWIVALVKGLGV